jgi:hypothetical protein
MKRAQQSDDALSHNSQRFSETGWFEQSPRMSVAVLNVFGSVLKPT